MIAPVEGLTISSCSNNDFTAMWAAGDWTPISQLNDREGAAIVFGDAIKASGPERLTATELRHLWIGSKFPEALDGIHVAVTYHPEKGLTVGADLLGLFPVYYFISDKVALIGPSPRLFQFHRSFKTSINTEGLVGIFLTKCILDGQTILTGVKRLNAGCLLKCGAGKQAEEILQFKIPVSEQYFGLTLAEQVEVIHRTFNEAILRHVPKNEKHCLLLSGGLDSSLLGGYLRDNARNVIAVTEGIPSDNEMKCATSMAKALGFEHVKFDIGYQGYARFAELSITWQPVLDGLIGLHTWGFYPYLRRISPRVINGFLGDGVFGNVIGWGLQKRGEKVSFDAYLRNQSGWAFRPETLRKLLKDENARNRVDDVLRKMREIYENYEGQDFQRIWCYSLNHIHRFHDGNGLWTLSFGSWPVLPFVDRKILEVLGGMPIEVMRDRRLEKELFKRKFPELARLPLSSNDFGATHLAPTFSQRIMDKIYGNNGIWRYKPLRDLRTVLFLALKGERRYWRRTATGFYNPGWKEVRKIAESDLKVPLPLLDLEMIQKLMPPPNSSFLNVQWKIMHGGIEQVSSLKLLMQFAMWSRRNYKMLASVQQGETQHLQERVIKNQREFSKYFV
jgi:asparagine synthase (glutamine-hydrolysing)